MAPITGRLYTGPVRFEVSALAAAVALSTASLASCTSLLGSDYRAVEAVGGAGGVSDGGGGGGGGGADPVGGGGAGGTGGELTGGLGGSGGAPPPLLVADGLLARYYLDEAASGTSVSEAKDAAADPLDLPILYEDAALAYTEVSGHRGLEWTQTGSSSRASALVVGTKVRATLNGSKALTVELCAEILETDGTPFVFLIGATGFATYGSVGVRVSSGALQFTWKDQIVGNWPALATMLGRVVIHAVVETEQAQSADRVRFYVDGVRVLGGPASPLAQGVTAEIKGIDSMVVGNDDMGSESARGTIYYAAVYAEALTDAQVDNNAAVLLASDDTPVSPP